MSNEGEAAPTDTLLPSENDGGRTENKEVISSKKKESTRYMKRTTLVILLGILNVFLLAILIFISAFFAKDKSQRVTINPSQTFCLPCNEVSIHPDDDPINFQYFTERKENGKEICCADHGQYLDKLMQLYVERKHSIKASEENTQQLQAACNSKIGDFMPQVMARVAGIKRTRPEGSYYVVDWEHGSASTTQFMQNITYDDNTDEFVINKPGYYYIYAQITMRVTAVAQQNPSKSLCFNIYKKPVSGNPEKLLESSRTQCKFQGDKSQSTSYIGAVFNLNKDDRLMVKVSDGNILEKSESKSYFGLHII